MAAQQKHHRSNEEITATTVRLVCDPAVHERLLRDHTALLNKPHPAGEESQALNGSANGQLGIMDLDQAWAMAEKVNLDLVEIAPNATPPVVRLMNLGKSKYEEERKQVKQKQIHVKEVKFRTGTGEHDYQVKLHRNILRFLNEGNKVKVTLRFRGREMTHQEIAFDLFKRIQNDLSSLTSFMLEQAPKLEGRQMLMLLAPKKK